MESQVIARDFHLSDSDEARVYKLLSSLLITDIAKLGESDWSTFNNDAHVSSFVIAVLYATRTFDVKYGGGDELSDVTSS